MAMWPRMVAADAGQQHQDGERQLHDVTVQLDNVDGEAHVISVCVQQIEPLDIQARARVFTYLYQRLGPKIGAKHEAS